MAYRALAQSPPISLQILKFDPVILLPADGDGVGAVVAGFAINGAMSFGIAVQRLVLCIGAAVTSGAIAARFIEPGQWILRNGGHSAMAADTRQAFLHRHDATQALGLRPGMTAIAPVHIRGYSVGVPGMHSIG